MPYNGLSHNLRDPPKGFVEVYVGRRQTAKAAHALSSKMVGGVSRTPTRQNLVWFGGLLYGGDGLVV